MAYPKKNVFHLQFAVGEFDMVISDPETVTCEIYEIKHSCRHVPQQCRHINDSSKCEAAAFRYGKITKKAVIYRGSDVRDDEISWINVESWLRQLPYSTF